MRSQNYNTSFSGSPSYLNKNFHYKNMSSAKCGKGYREDGHPIGVLSGKCKKEGCEGDIITLQMNTSSKGFTTNSERVCLVCGRVYNLGFQILGSTPEINVDPTKWQVNEEADEFTKKAKHDLWKKDMQESQSNPEVEPEDPGAYSTILPSEDKIWTNKEIKQYTTTGSLPLSKRQLNKKIYKSGSLLALKRALKYTTTMKDFRTEHYIELIGAVESQYLDMSALQIERAEKIIENRGNLFKLNKPVEDIVFCICLYVLSLDMDYRKFNALLGRTIRNSRVTFDLKTLYPTVREKLKDKDE